MSTLSPERWQAVSPYLDQALAIPEDERAAWLAKLREQNPELADQVQALLNEHHALSKEGFLQDALVSVPVQLGLPGQIVGAYTLVSPIGEGGMGSVWLAERSDGRFERRAAVKFLSLALAGRGGQERFQREGAILGRLAHPHIAELIDAGVSSSGQPYLVLEHVEGVHIDQYCDVGQFDIEARIRIFLDVLSAVAHAHANLVVHRDLKPSNVLVRNDGQVKLLDFGIAKLLEEAGKSVAATQLTQQAGTALTLAYAAPEQVTGQPVTTATDVYALGVLLYLLLTGQHPAGLATRSTADLIKAIIDTEPPRASSMISLVKTETKELAFIAAKRATTSDKLARQLRGDLDTILAKTLKKAPAERYPSVTALADDLQRFLKHEPISARPDTVRYRAVKFLRRNRTAVALSGLALAVAMAGVAATLLQARNARRERDIAFRERDRANRVTNFMSDMFKVSDPNETGAKDVTARQILDKASGDINTGLANNPELQAQMMHVMGNVYINLGLYDRAQSLLQRSIELNRNARGALDPETLSTMDTLGSALIQQGRGAEAEKIQRVALEGQRSVLGPVHPDTLTTMGDLAGTLAMEGRLNEAERLQRDTLEIQTRVLGIENHHTIVSMDTLATILGEEGRFAESEQLEAKAIDLERRVYGPDHLAVVMSMANQVDTLYLMGKYVEAKQLLKQTLDIQRRVLDPNHPETARSLYNLGCLAARDLKRDEAFSFFEQAIDHLSPRSVPEVNNDPDLNSLHGDSRFAKLVARAKLRGASGAKCPL